MKILNMSVDLLKNKKRLLIWVYVLVLTPPCAELILRLLQYSPFQQVPYSIEAEPEVCLLPHSRLGFALRPGLFQLTINEGLRFQVTHGADSLRITGRAAPDTTLPEWWIMGCSYTYGLGLEDSLSMPYLLQKQVPKYRVRNFAVPGYGTVQSYLQLKQALVSGQRPEGVVICFADFHLARNALSRHYRRDLYMGYRRSQARLDSLMMPSRIPFVEAQAGGFGLAWCDWEQVYPAMWGREQFALVNLVQDVGDRLYDHDLDEQAITRFIFCQIKQLCDQHHVDLRVVGLTQNSATRKMLKSLSKMDIMTRDISLDLLAKEWHNDPHDQHPNARAHRHFAIQVAAFVASARL